MTSSPRIPVATYRLQMNRDFPLREAANVLPYLARLGVTDCYLSPLLQARPGSAHGYDITDHNSLNPDLGPASDFETLQRGLRDHAMGVLLDFVPNHMGIDPETNAWWRDVLENGPSSPFAAYFDIDWNPIKPALKNKILLPILSDQYGAVLESGGLQLLFEEGRLALQAEGQKLPVNPRQSPDVLSLNLDVLEREMAGRPELREFLSILTELRHLPEDTDNAPGRIEERQREKEVARDRLAALVHSSEPIRRHLLGVLRALNGRPGEPESFDAMDRFLESQAYRLAYWKTAFHEINYRRFFDINQLAGLRMERSDVFQATHRLLLSWIREGQVTGLRLDHPDGLYDPAAYFQRLQKEAGPLYVVVEKILSADEALRKSWPVHGTTGYNFLNLVNHLMIDSKEARRLREIYERFTGRTADSQDEMYRSKKLIMATSMASELNVLAHLLDQISETNRRWRDFTLESLRDALLEVVACFPVYRTYFSDETTSPSDELVITKAAQRAKELNPALEASIFDFVRSMLVPRRLPGLAAEEYQRRLEFAMKFQQYTSPVQAKGVEDTAFYRHPVLLSINEVGGDLERFGLSVSDFHRLNLERQREWPGALNATATHDTKRGEDSRARLNVLSERPEEWERSVFRWAEINRPHKTLLEDRAAPDANDEYLLYQTLLGAWPAGLESVDADPALAGRLQAYALKAIREAKRRTSWIRPNEAYEKATADFLKAILQDTRPGGFFSLFLPFVQQLSADGLLNSLAQVALKLACPGVPDFYQGTELWDWSLVDPDNRRPVDFEWRRRLLDELEPLAEPLLDSGGQSAAIQQYLRHWEDGKIKMLLTTRMLRYRRAFPILFAQGSYRPIDIIGEKADHAVAFSREWENQKLLVVVPRLVAKVPLKSPLWESLRLALPSDWAPSAWRHVLTGERIGSSQEGLQGTSLAGAFATLPVAWLSPLP